jgi:hypothetical protein
MAQQTIEEIAVECALKLEKTLPSVDRITSIVILPDCVVVTSEIDKVVRTASWSLLGDA